MSQKAEELDSNCEACKRFDPIEIISTDLEFEKGVQEFAESNELMEKIKKHYLTALFTNCIKHHPIIPHFVDFALLPTPLGDIA